MKAWHFLPLILILAGCQTAKIDPNSLILDDYVHEITMDFSGKDVTLGMVYENIERSINQKYPGKRIKFVVPDDISKPVIMAAEDTTFEGTVTPLGEAPLSFYLDYLSKLYMVKHSFDRAEIHVTRDLPKFEN